MSAAFDLLSRGTFAQWQPIYAKHGIVTVPCSAEKRPLIKNPQKFGLAASKAVANRFSEAPALGFYAGSRNKLTVLDVDSTDERILRVALDHHGHTPLIVRTASGKFHGYYKNNGERRKIRPWGEQQLPIDVLGAGLCIAPPSISAKGTYEIIEGSLDDLNRLPIMRGLGASFYSHAKAKLYSPPTDNATPWEQMRDHNGRNKALFNRLGREVHCCDDFEQLVDRGRTLNDGFAQPLEDKEAINIVTSVWKMTVEGRNRFGKHGSWLITADVDALIANPYALGLLSWLQAHNGPASKFWVADGLAKKLGWSRRKFTSARERITKAGWIVPLNKPFPGHPILYRWGGPAPSKDAEGGGGVC